MTTTTSLNIGDHITYRSGWQAQPLTATVTKVSTMGLGVPWVEVQRDGFPADAPTARLSVLGCQVQRITKPDTPR